MAAPPSTAFSSFLLLLNGAEARTFVCGFYFPHVRLLWSVLSPSQSVGPTPPCISIFSFAICWVDPLPHRLPDIKRAIILSKSLPQRIVFSNVSYLFIFIHIYESTDWAMVDRESHKSTTHRSTSAAYDPTRELSAYSLLTRKLFTKSSPINYYFLSFAQTKYFGISGFATYWRLNNNIMIDFIIYRREHVNLNSEHMNKFTKFNLLASGTPFILSSVQYLHV